MLFRHPRAVDQNCVVGSDFPGRSQKHLLLLRFEPIQLVEHIFKFRNGSQVGATYGKQHPGGAATHPWLRF